MAGELLDPLHLLAALVLEDGRRWGDAATDVQWADARAVLTPGDGPRRHWIGRSRGYSKSSDVAAFSLVAVLTQLSAGQDGFVVAADKDQAEIGVLRAARGFIARTPELQGHVEVQAYRIVSHDTGAVIDAVAADGSSSWGLRPYWLALDELCQWPSTRNAREVYDAVMSAVPKVPTCRLMVMSTAGDPAHFSRKLYDSALADRLWHVSEVHGPPPWMDPAEIEFERARLLPSQFARLYENRWAASEDRLVDPADLEACCSLSGPVEPAAGKRYVIGLDVGLKHDRTVAAVCHVDYDKVRTTDVDGIPQVREAFERPFMVTLDRIRVWSGTREQPVRLEEVEAWLEKTSVAYNRARVVFDPWQAQGSMQRLSRRGVPVEEFTFSASSVGHLFYSLYTVLHQQRARLPVNDPALRDELLNVRVRETSPGVYRMDHDSGRHDDRAQAFALAVHSLTASMSDGSATRFFDQLVDLTRSQPSQPSRALHPPTIRDLRGDRSRPLVLPH